MDEDDGGSLRRLPRAHRGRPGRRPGGQRPRLLLFPGRDAHVLGRFGCGSLGLEGEVDMADWRALFGPGGPHHPGSGERLVACMRPGMELVVSPGKSVAELGVIGRAEDMHAILDAETAATLEYLDQVTREQGGRRGRAQLRTPTGGLTWAVSRHATTRAGDPQPHDHVLIANVVSMGDARGGWKALDTALLRDHLHAATAIGRMAAAAKAVELGYGIEPDPGPSGRLGSFAISGIPKEAWEVHATRSAQIDAAVGREASYQARSMAARTTRDKKEHTMVEDLLPRWRAELAEAGYPPAELAAAVERADRPTCRRAPTSSTSWRTNYSAPVGAWRPRRLSTCGTRWWRWLRSSMACLSQCWTPQSRKSCPTSGPWPCRRLPVPGGRCGRPPACWKTSAGWPSSPTSWSSGGHRPSPTW